VATYAELRRKRVQAARAARRLQREADTAIEKIERRMDTLIERKTIIDQDAALTLVPLYNEFKDKVSKMEKGIADFISVVRV